MDSPDDSYTDESPTRAGMRTYARKRPEIIEGVEELCRLCLEKEGGTNIFDKENVVPSLTTRIMMCVGIEVQEEEFLPNLICNNCQKDLDHSYTFRKKCEINNIKLKSHIRAMQFAKKSLQINERSVEKHTQITNSDNQNELNVELNDVVAITIIENDYDMCDNQNDKGLCDSLILQDDSENDESNKMIIKYEIVRNDNGVISTYVKTNDANCIEEETNTINCDGKQKVLADSSLMENNQSKENSNKTNEHRSNSKSECSSPSHDLEEELAEFLLTKLEENNIVSLEGGYVALRGMTSLRLLASDGSTLEMQLAEEDPKPILSNETIVESEDANNWQISREGEKIQKTKTSDVRHPTCPECYKTFSSRSVLKRHMLVHANAMPFQCKICSRLFRQRAVLNRHMLVHDEERPHKCPMCPKSFTQRGALNAHARAHSAPPKRPLRLHRCAACGKNFLYLSGLSRHMRLHTGKVFPCASCGRTFRDQSSLKRHARAHHQTPLSTSQLSLVK